MGEGVSREERRCRENREASKGSCPSSRQTDSIMVEMSDLDEEAAVNDRSSLTLSRGNDAPIQAEQISCRGKEGTKEETGV